MSVVKAPLCSLLLALGLSLAPRSQAEDAPFQASASCEPAAGPGRIVCELRAKATRGQLVWSDALVVRAPAFARPLRSRIVAQSNSPGASGGAWAKFALVAADVGTGKLELLARGVLCHEDSSRADGGSCTPVRAPITVELRVGAPSPPTP